MQDAVQAQDTVYHKQGVNLVLTARREDRLQEVCRMFEEKGTHAVSYAGDAVQEETAERTVKLAMDAFGRIDMLLSNAGIGRTAEGMEKRKGTRVMEMHFAGMQGN